MNILFKLSYASKISDIPLNCKDIRNVDIKELSEILYVSPEI